MLFHAQVPTRRRLAIEGGREDAMLDRHAFRTAVHESVEACSAPRSGDLGHLFRRELDRQHESICAKPEHLGGSVLVEDVESIVADDILSGARQLVEQAEVAGEKRHVELEPLVSRLAILGSDDCWRPKAEANVSRSERVAKLED